MPQNWGVNFDSAAKFMGKHYVSCVKSVPELNWGADDLMFGIFHEYSPAQFFFFLVLVSPLLLFLVMYKIEPFIILKIRGGNPIYGFRSLLGTY